MTLTINRIIGTRERLQAPLRESSSPLRRKNSPASSTALAGSIATRKRAIPWMLVTPNQCPTTANGAESLAGELFLHAGELGFKLANAFGRSSWASGGFRRSRVRLSRLSPACICCSDR